MKKEEQTNLNNKQKEVLKKMLLKSKEDFTFYVKNQKTDRAVLKWAIKNV